MSYRKINLSAAVKIALAVNAGAVMGGMPLLAAAEADTIEEVVVTGSRIPRNDLNGPSPVSVYDSGAIARSGATSIGQFLREAPAIAGAGQTTAINNGGTGSQNISLRGLDLLAPWS